MLTVSQDLAVRVALMEIERQGSRVETQSLYTGAVGRARINFIAGNGGLMKWTLGVLSEENG